MGYTKSLLYMGNPGVFLVWGYAICAGHIYLQETFYVGVRKIYTGDILCKVHKISPIHTGGVCVGGCKMPPI